MKCYEKSTRVYYPHHEEFVEAAGPRGRALGFCVRCGEVIDLAVCAREARAGSVRASAALEAAGLKEPDQWQVVIVTTHHNPKRTYRSTFGRFADANAARDAFDKIAPLSRDDRDEGWISVDLDVEMVPGRLIGAAQS